MEQVEEGEEVWYGWGKGEGGRWKGEGKEEVERVKGEGEKGEWGVWYAHKHDLRKLRIMSVQRITAIVLRQPQPLTGRLERGVTFVFFFLVVVAVISDPILVAIAVSRNHYLIYSSTYFCYE